jgi:hypothetical protein
MTDAHTFRLKLHFCALILEALATLFIFLEAARFDAMAGILGYASFAGEPVKYQHWYYHCGVLGFAFLVTGILVSACCLYLEHRAIHHEAKSKNTHHERKSRKHHRLTEREKFDFLREEIDSEQEFFWSRFAGFATLHAGLFVLVTSDAIKHTKPLFAAAAVLAAVWLYVQVASLFYVNRLKPQFRNLCEIVGFEYPRHPFYSFISTTDVALIVPIGLTVLWIVFLF